MKAIHRKLLLLPDNEEDVKQSTTVLSANLPRYFLIPPSTTTAANNDTGTNTTVRKHVRPISSFDSSLALAVVVLLTALFFMGFFSVYLRRLSEESPVEISRRRRRSRLRGGGLLTGPKFGGVDPIIIQSLPLFSYEQSEKEPLDCAVCLTEFEEKESVKMVPNCGHVFHPECIDKWLGSHASCPLCRSTQLLLVQEKKRESIASSSTSRDAIEPTMTVANPLRVEEREGGVCLSSSWSRSLRRKSSWPSLLVVDKQEVIREGGVLLRRSLSL